MEKSSQLQTLTALPQGKEPPVSIGWEADLSEMVSLLVVFLL
jgi:hypothetical protein